MEFKPPRMISAITEEVKRIKAIEALNSNLRAAGQTPIEYDTNGTVTVPFHFKVTMTIQEETTDSSGNATTTTQNVTGEICIDVVYSNAQG